MGEAKEIVGAPARKSKHSSQSDGDLGFSSDDCLSHSAVIPKLESVIDNLDKAISIKQEDLLGEGDALKAENHYKLGILKAADSLIRRAKELLCAYGADLRSDIEIGTTTMFNKAKKETKDAIPFDVDKE